jgi:UDP-N-acetylglucosamine 2-epimerase (non-hydrolysing)
LVALSRQRTVVSVVGTRPNFMKTLPVARALEERPGLRHVLVHTGQHYDRAMSDVFFEELGARAPDHFLGVGSGSHSQQTARVITALEPLLRDAQPDIVLVPGDVNSTLAAALCATQLGIAVGHIEAGLRSFDRTMPEELNRILTDQMSALLFTHSPEARDHLLAEGRPAEAIHPVGNTMIDTLAAMRERIAAERAPEALGLAAGGYIVVTLHRPALVDGPLLADAMAALADLAESYEVVFPVHPRTRARIDAENIPTGAVRLLEPLGYVTFLGLVADAAGVLTDSGGIQEETTYLGVPCFTLRDNTERPVTCSLGTNVLLGLEPGAIRSLPDRLAGGREEPTIPPGWDGHAAERIADVVALSAR